MYASLKLGDTLNKTVVKKAPQSAQQPTKKNESKASDDIQWMGSKKADMGAGDLAQGGAASPDVASLQAQDVSDVMDDMTTSTAGPRTTIVKHKGKRIGQITKTGASNDQKLIASHDKYGEHPKMFSTQGAAKAALADMHLHGKKAKKRDASYFLSEKVAYKTDFTESERRDLAKSGAAMSDGSYPIRNGEDLHHAISLVGMSNHSESSVKDHIKDRAKALGLESELPDSWKKEPAKKSAIPGTLQSDPNTTDTMQEDPDVDSLQKPSPYFDIMSQRHPAAKLRVPGEFSAPSTVAQSGVVI